MWQVFVVFALPIVPRLMVFTQLCLDGEKVRIGVNDGMLNDWLMRWTETEGFMNGMDEKWNLPWKMAIFIDKPPFSSHITQNPLRIPTLQHSRAKGLNLSKHTKGYDRVIQECINMQEWISYSQPDWLADPWPCDWSQITVIMVWSAGMLLWGGVIYISAYTCDTVRH